MKKILLIACCAALCSAGTVKAQSFVPQADTVWCNANTSGMTNLSDTIAVPAPVTLKWRVLETDFPASWLPEAILGICDAALCRQNVSGQLWNGTSGTLFTCAYPGIGNSHDFHLQINLVGAAGGTHYMTVRVDDNVTLLSKKMTFVINNGPTSVAAVSAGLTGIGIFPNPAQGKAQVIFTLAAASQVQCRVYDMAGRNVYSTAAAQMNAGKQSIDLSTTEMAAGVYNVVITTDKGTVTQQLTVAK